MQTPKPIPPFPEALKDTRRYENDREIFETFSKCEVNIPLLKLIKSIPRYAKFLKELCTIKKKQRLKKKEKVSLNENVSAMLQRKLPEKCGDPGMFTIPCAIGNTRFKQAMLDLGASINVISYNVYMSLGLGALTETGVTVQLADRSQIRPRGVVEDVLVMVDDLFFPVDFFILDMEQGAPETPIILGRPFLKTAKMKNDYCEGLLTMEFDGRKIEFSLFNHYYVYN